MLAAEEIRQSCNLEYEEEKDTDTVDPGLFIDELPQPYKYIDFLLDELLCNAFDLYAERCEKRRVECNRRKVNDLHCEAYIFGYGLPDIVLSDFSTVALFGNGNSFSAVDNNISAIKQEVTETVDKRNEMRYAHQRKLSSTDWLICTSDSSGKVYLYGLCDGHIFLLRELQDVDSGSGTPSVACTIAISNDASNMAICWTGGTDKFSSFMEIFSLPKETWLKELSSAASRISMKQDDQGSAAGTVGDSLQESKQDDISTVNIDIPNEDTTQGEELAQSSPTDHGFHFSKPTSIMKIQLVDPGNKPTPLTLGSALKSVEGENAPIGSGLSHLLTPQFCESYANKMKENYDDYLRFLKPEDATQPAPFVSFLALTKQGSNSDAAPTDPPAMVAVARPYFNQVYGYSLSKSSKDTARKPDLVLPNAAGIVYMAVSGCTTLLALVTEVGHLIIWNRQLARPLKIESLPEEKPPRFFKFASIEGQISVEERLLLGISTEYQQLVQIHCSYYECSEFVPVVDRSSLERDDVLDVVLCGPKPAWIAGIRESGRITIFDLITNDAVAHIKPLDGFEFSFKPNPFICFLDSKVFVKAIRTRAGKDLDTDRPQGGVLVYSMDNINTTQEETVPAKHGNRMSSSNKHISLHKDWKLELLRRYQQKDDRARRLKRRWAQFKQGIEMKVV